MNVEYSVSIIWEDGVLDAPSVEEVELLLSEIEAIMLEMKTHDETDDS